MKKQDKSRLGSMIVVRSFNNILLVIVRFSKGGLDNYFNDKNLLKMQSCIFYLIHASIKLVRYLGLLPKIKQYSKSDHVRYDV